MVVMYLAGRYEPTFLAYLSSLFPATLSQYFVGIIIILAGLIVGRLAGRLVTLLLHELEIDRILQSRGIHFSLKHSLSLAVSGLIYVVAVLFALLYIGVGRPVMIGVAVVALLVFLISFFLAIKDTVPNLVAGLIIHHRSMFEVGDKLTYGDLSGRVEEIALLETRIKTKANDLIYIPNALLIKKVVVLRRR